MPAKDKPPRWRKCSGKIACFRFYSRDDDSYTEAAGKDTKQYLDNGGDAYDLQWLPEDNPRGRPSQKRPNWAGLSIFEATHVWVRDVDEWSEETFFKGSWRPPTPEESQRFAQGKRLWRGSVTYG